MTTEEMMVREWFWSNHWCGLGFQIYPYQLALGISLRWWDSGPAFRVYLGPLKVWGYLRHAGG